MVRSLDNVGGEMSDKEIIATVRKILDALHHPDTGFNAFRKELRKQHLKQEEYERRIADKEYELAARYGMTRENTHDEIKFRLSGKDVMDSRLYVSCGQAAKAFCYVNSTLPKNEQLDLKVLFSTDVEHLIDGRAGHTLPCVRLSDGKWHAIEPQIQPQKGTFPGFEFVCDDVQVGGEIWHQLEGIKKKGRPYQITKIITPQEHATTYSDFGKFLAASTVHKGRSAFVCAGLGLVLKNTNPGQYKNGYRQIYEICKGVDENISCVKVWVFARGEDIAFRICVELDGVQYYINPSVQYLSLIKLESDNNFGFSESGFVLQQTLTAQEYIKEYELRNQLLSHNNDERML
jgi:hypothetical protein